MGKNTTDILRTKAVLNFALSLIAKGGKTAPSIYSALKAPILFRNDSLTSEKSKAKSHLTNEYIPFMKNELEAS